MKKSLSRFPVALTMLFAASACDDGVGPINETLECTTNVTAAQSDAWVEVCELDVPVRHVRIENFKAPRSHASAQIVFGFNAPPASADGDLGAGQFRVLMYGGGVPFPTPQFQASFGATDIALGEETAFINEGGTVCFDIHDGGATVGPHFTIWVDGVSGADCENDATLTTATAYRMVTDWDGTVGAVDKEAKIYFRQSAAGGTAPVIRLFDEPVIPMPS